MTLPMSEAVPLYVERYPDSSPIRPTVIVFLHGFSLDRRIWEGQKPIADHIAGGATLLFPDARGHGLSEAPPTGYSRAHRVADVLRTLDHLGVPNAHLVGHSMGGSTAIGMALEHKDRVASLTLVATGAAGWKNGGWIDDLFRRAQTMPVDQIHEEWISKSISYFSSPERVHVGRLMEQIMRDNSGAFWHDPMRGKYPAPPPDLERMREIRCPLLILVGEEDRKFVTLARAIHGAAPASRMEILPGVGHMLSLEAPEQVNELIVEHVGGALSGTFR